MGEPIAWSLVSGESHGLLGGWLKITLGQPKETPMLGEPIGCGSQIGVFSGTLSGNMDQNLRSDSWWLHFDPYPIAWSLVPGADGPAHKMASKLKTCKALPRRESSAIACLVLGSSWNPGATVGN